MRPEGVADLAHEDVCNEPVLDLHDLDMVTVLADKHDSIMENRDLVPPMLF